MDNGKICRAPKVTHRQTIFIENIVKLFEKVFILVIFIKLDITVTTHSQTCFGSP